MDRGASAKPTLRQLRAFVAVAQTCNFTRAAEQLRLPQPLVSNLVRDLEAEVGFKLFDRTTRRVAVTEAAVEFFQDARRLMREVDGVFSRAGDVSGGRRGRLRVGAPPLLAAALLPPVIEAFRGSCPDVEVVLFDRSIAALQGQLREGELSLAVGTFPHDDEVLARIPLVTDLLALLCRGDHPLAAGAEVSWSALAGVDLVALRTGNGIRSQMDRGFATAGIEVRPAFELDQLATVVAMVDAGFGVTVLPLYALRRLPMRSLVARPLHPSMKREVELVHLRDRSLSPAAVEFARLLKLGAIRIQDEGRRMLTQVRPDDP